jgi:hypothetical protein
MGLGISVGMLCDQARNDPEGFEAHRDAFEQLAQALAAEGIEWREPEVIHTVAGHDFSSGFPYSYLAHLRRAFTLAQLGEPVTAASAISDDEYARDQEKVADESTMFTSHLLCHADYAGYYIPVDFEDPLFLPEETNVAGAGMVGSSQRLLAELVGFAASIGVQLDENGAPNTTEEAMAAAGLADAEAFDAERFAWTALHGACLASVESGHAIVFC